MLLHGGLCGSGELSDTRTVVFETSGPAHVGREGGLGLQSADRVGREMR